MLRKLLLAAALLVGAAVALAAPPDPNEIPVPKLTAHVMDQAGTLTAAERDALDAKLADFERSHGSQVVVLIEPSIGTEAIEDFATRVTDEWKLGRKGVDDGVLFVIAMRQRAMRIHTGRGVQGTLTDYLSKQIVADIVAPRFRNGDFAGGIGAGADAIIKAIEGEKLPLAERNASSGKVSAVSSYSNFLVLAFFLVPVLGMVLRGIFGRLFGAGITGGLTGVAAWLFFGSLAFAILGALFAFVFTIVGGFGRGIRVGPPGPGWGGGFGGGGFGGGGGGGFGGGGGTFDGGGASGRW
ncbi:MAG TPA: TPM domain-containing protein [Usitatibacter sp.]|nr:TPM domain-containing protein [Usitatibacter sp.]